MRHSGPLRTFAQGYRNEFDLGNAQSKMQLASHLAGQFIDKNDGCSDKKTTFRSVLTGLNRQCQQRKSLFSSAKKSTSKISAPALILDLQSSWQQSFESLYMCRCDLPSPQSFRRPQPSSVPLCEEREPPAVVSTSACNESASSSSDSGDLNELDLSLQINPEDEEIPPCAHVSFDASEIRDDDEISILSNGEPVDEFDLAIFQNVFDPFPDETVDYSFDTIAF